MSAIADLTAARRPWAAIPIYAAIFALSILYQTDVTDAVSLTDASNRTVALLWQWALTLGSAAALIALTTPGRYVLTAKVIESAGAGVLAVEVGVYVGALIGHSPNQIPWATVLFASGIAAAFAMRAVLALRERWALLQALATLEAARKAVV